jgi:hypothetical protein
VFEAFDDLVAEPAMCTGCTFSIKKPLCRVPYAKLPRGANCSQGTEISGSIHPGSCNSFDFLAGGSSDLRFFAPQVDDSGACEVASEGSEYVPPATWQTNWRFCAASPATADDCDSEESCLPLTVAPAESNLCIVAEGSLPCPSGAYSRRFEISRSLADDRSCGTCAANLEVQSAQCHVKLGWVGNPSGIGDCLCGYGSKCESILQDGNWSALCPARSSEWQELAVGFSVEEEKALEFEGKCTGSLWGQQGGAAGVDPLTVCCAG